MVAVEIVVQELRQQAKLVTTPEEIAQVRGQEGGREGEGGRGREGKGGREEPFFSM